MRLRLAVAPDGAACICVRLRVGPLSLVRPAARLAA
jgi:hypothetical protein